MANVFEMDMELKMRDLSLSCAMYSLQIPKSGFWVAPSIEISLDSNT